MYGTVWTYCASRCNYYDVYYWRIDYLVISIIIRITKTYIAGYYITNTYMNVTTGMYIFTRLLYIRTSHTIYATYDIGPISSYENSIYSAVMNNRVRSYVYTNWTGFYILNPCRYDIQLDSIYNSIVITPICWHRNMRCQHTNKPWPAKQATTHSPNYLYSRMKTNYRHHNNTMYFSPTTSCHVEQGGNTIY